MPRPNLEQRSGTHAIKNCVRVVRESMHMPDTSPMMAALGCIAANYMSGPPVWLMLVSPPSSGKTQIINSCMPLPHCYPAGQAKNSSAYLTHDKEFGQGGMLSDPRRDKDGNETGGIGDFGILLYTEFSTILSLPLEQRDEVISVHRQIYDGYYSRQFGANGGRKLEWEGKCGSLGAVTMAIDNHAMTADLGERWIYYRFPPSDIKAQAGKALMQHDVDPADTTMEFRAAVLDVFHEARIELNETRKPLDDNETQQLAELATVSCKLRGVVARDRHSHEIISSPQIEGAGRMAKALAGMYTGLNRIGLVNDWCWNITRKIGIDSAPALRFEILRAIKDCETSNILPATTEVTNRLKVSRKTGERHLQDMEKLNVTRIVDHVWQIDPVVRRVTDKMKFEARCNL